MDRPRSLRRHAPDPRRPLGTLGISLGWNRHHDKTTEPWSIAENRTSPWCQEPACRAAAIARPKGWGQGERGGRFGDWLGDRPGSWGAPTGDTELIAASLVEPARFAEPFDRHYPAILRYLRRRVGPDLADDLAAETFTLAFRRRRQYRAEHPDAAAAARRAALAVADLPAEQREVLLLSCVGFGWYEEGQWDNGKVGMLG
jgi:hypothetical protein